MLGTPSNLGLGIARNLGDNRSLEENCVFLTSVCN
jgi:hypothetical protein